MNDKVKQLREKLLQMEDTEFQALLDEGKEITNHEWRKKQARYASTGYLRFQPNKIYELAKPFTNPWEMEIYEGDNQEMINSAGRYISQKVVERPEWFSDDKLNQTKEEVTEEAQPYTKWSDIPYSIQQKLWRHYTPQELRIVLPNIIWGHTDWTDDMIVDTLSKYKDNREVRKAKVDKHLLTKLQVDKGKKYPKSYELYKSMMIDPSEQKRSKRGSYTQRTPAIEQYDLNKNYIQTFQTWDDAKKAGFNRSSLSGAIRGTDGHNKHKGFLWKHEGQDFTK